MPLQGRFEVLRAQPMNVFRFTNRPFQAFGGKHDGDVEEGSRECGDRDPSPFGGLVRVELRTVPTDRSAGSRRARDRDLDSATFTWTLDPPERSRGAMAQNRPPTRTQNCGEPAALAWNNTVAHRVHPGMQSMQTTGANSPLECAFGQSQLEELRPRYDPVLTPGKGRYLPIERSRLCFPSVCDGRCSFTQHAPTLTDQAARLVR
jgi:hypothetical protein